MIGLAKTIGLSPRLGELNLDNIDNETPCRRISIAWFFEHDYKSRFGDWPITLTEKHLQELYSMPRDHRIDSNPLGLVIISIKKYGSVVLRPEFGD